MKSIKKYKTHTLLILSILFIGLYSCEKELTYPDTDKLPPAKYATQSWTVLDYSSQEDQGGEGETGRAKDIIDGNSDTFWHTCWSGCTPEAPHFISIDMMEELEISGFYLIQRQSLSRNIEKVRLESSIDGTNWTLLGEYDLEKTASQQELKLAEKSSFRYFKMTVISVFDASNNAALAELTPFISYN